MTKVRVAELWADLRRSHNMRLIRNIPKHSETFRALQWLLPAHHLSHLLSLKSRGSKRDSRDGSCLQQYICLNVLLENSDGHVIGDRRKQWRKSIIRRLRLPKITSE